jgi:hypothetical protein
MDFFVLSEVVVKKIFPNMCETIICPVELGGLSFIGDMNDVACGVPMRMGMPNRVGSCYVLFEAIPNLQFLMSMCVLDIDHFLWEEHVPWLPVVNSVMLRLVSMYLRFSGYDKSKGVVPEGDGMFFGGIYVSQAVCRTISDLYKKVINFCDVQCNNTYVIQELACEPISCSVGSTIMSTGVIVSDCVNVNDKCIDSINSGEITSTSEVISPVNGQIHEVMFVEQLNHVSVPVPIVAKVGHFSPFIVTNCKPYNSLVYDGFFMFNNDPGYYCMPILCSDENKSTWPSVGYSISPKGSSQIKIVMFSELKNEYIFSDVCMLPLAFKVFEWSPDLHLLLSGCTVTQFSNGFLINMIRPHPVWGCGGFFFPYRLNRASIMFWLARFFISGDFSKYSMFYERTESYMELVRLVLFYGLSGAPCKVRYKPVFVKGQSYMSVVPCVPTLVLGYGCRAVKLKYDYDRLPSINEVSYVQLPYGCLDSGSFDSSFFHYSRDVVYSGSTLRRALLEAKLFRASTDYCDTQHNMRQLYPSNYVMVIGDTSIG